MIFYAVFSVILLAFIFLITLIQETNKRSLDLFYMLAEDARTTNNLDEFTKYQSVAYRKLDQIETTDYSFHIYQVIAQTNDQYANQFSIFVIPKGDVNHASELNDPSDQTGITLKNHVTDEVIYQTTQDTSYTDYAVSFGINKIGFYYYAITLDESYQMDMTLVDYNGSTILSTLVDFNYIAYDPNNLGDLSLGYTDEEVTDLLNLAAYVQPALFQNITIFLVIDVAVGALIYYFLKKKIMME